MVERKHARVAWQAVLAVVVALVMCGAPALAWATGEVADPADVTVGEVVEGDAGGDKTDEAAGQTDGTTDEADETTGDVNGAAGQASLYDQLMAAETAEAMNEIIGGIEDEPSFTAEQLAALQSKVDAFENGDAKTALVAILASLASGENDVEPADGSTTTTTVSNVTAVEITDSISTDGRYTIKVTADGTIYTGEEAADILKASGYTVSWTMDGTTITLGQTLTTTSGDQLASDADGGWVNVGLLQGGEKTFVVTISESGTTDVTSSKTCSYSAELKNGSFETPDHSTFGEDKTNVYTMNNDGGSPYYWQTTAGRANIDSEGNSRGSWNSGDNLDGEEDYVEIGVTNSKGLESYGASTSGGSIGTPDGDQFAELNAEANGAFYQTVLTMPGQTMNWQFYHRARSAGWTYEYNPGTGYTDDMSMLIVPEELAVDLNLTTQDKLKEFYDSLVLSYGGNKGTYTYINAIKGKTYTIYVCDDSSSIQRTNNYNSILYSNWNYCNGTFTVPEGQYLTRFFFMAQDTAGNKISDPKGLTIGNLLDNVWFSQSAPPVAQGTAKITVYKEVHGLSDDDAKAVLNKVGLITQDSNTNCTLTSFTETSDGVWRGTYELEISTIISGQTITHAYAENTTAAAKDGYNLTTTVDGATVTGNSKSVSVTYDDNSKTVTFVNTYTPATRTLTLTKKVTGNMGDTSKEFTFTVSTNTGTLAVPTDGNATLNSDGTVTAQLHNNETATITVPYGADITIAETAVTGYTTTYKVDSATTGTSGNTCTVSNISGNTSVEFTNNKDVTIDTGVSFDSAGPIAVGAIAAAGIAAAVVRGKRRAGSED